KIAEALEVVSNLHSGNYLTNAGNRWIPSDDFRSLLFDIDLECIENRIAIDHLSSECHISLGKRVKGMCDLLRGKFAHLCDQPNELLPINIQKLAFTSEH